MLLLLFLALSLRASEDTTIEIVSHPESSMSTPMRNICDDMILYYFKGNGVHIRDQIKPYLERRLNQSWKRTKIQALESVPLGRESVQLEPELERFIIKKVSQALEEAFAEEHQTRLRYQSEARERLTKNKVAVITTVTNMVTALVTAGITLAIAFGT